MNLPAIQSPNTFQRLMLEWEKFAPYNAGQFLTFDSCDEQSRSQLAQSWRQVVEHLKLDQLFQTSINLDCPAVPIAGHITRELNRRFEEGDALLRPFMIQNGNRLHAGIMYRHVMADSVSIRMLMNAWLTGAIHQQLKLDYSEKRVHFLRAASEVLYEVSRLRQIRRIRRLPRKCHMGDGVSWSMHELPEGLIDRLVAHCRAHGAKVNDLFVSIAARIGSTFVPFEPHLKRLDLAVGSIVDLRSPAQDTFGLSLGFFQTCLTMQEIRDRTSALRTSHRAAERARKRGIRSASQLRLRAALWQHKRLGQHDLTTFYRKRCAFVCGISNVNLNQTQIGQWSIAKNATYTRVSPLGPMLPVVFTPTTVGSRVTLGVTTRDGLIDSDRREKLIKAFINELIEWGG